MTAEAVGADGPRGRDGAARARVLEAALRDLAATAGLDLAAAWRWRFAPPADMAADAFRDALLDAAATARPGALALRLREGPSRAREAREARVWVAGAAIGRSGVTSPPLPEREALAAAARLCDGTLLRLGLPRAAAAALRDAEGRPLGAAATLRREGGGWRSAPRALEPALEPERAREAGDGAPARLAMRAEAGRLVVALPAAPDLDAWLELVFAVEEAAAALRLGLRFEGPAPPADPRLDRMTAEAAAEGVTLAFAPRPGLGARRNRVAAALAASGAAGARMIDAALAVGDAPGAGRGLALWPEAAARAVADWLARPGLARLLGRADAAPRRLEARGLAAAAETELALERLRAETDAPAEARLAGLAALLEGSELGLERDPPAAGGGARLIFRDLAPGGSAASLLAAEAALLGLVARAARGGAAVPAPPELARPRDRFDLPSAIWADVGGFLSGLGVALGDPELLPPDMLRPLFEARFPEIGRVEGAGLKLTLRFGAEAAAGARRVEARLEGDRADGLALEAEGRPAPALRCPLTGGRIFGLRLQAEPAPAGPHPTLPPTGPVRLAVAAGPERRARLAARLDLSGAAPVLERIAASAVPARREGGVSAAQPATLDLRRG